MVMCGQAEVAVVYSGLVQGAGRMVMTGTGPSLAWLTAVVSLSDVE